MCVLACVFMFMCVREREKERVREVGGSERERVLQSRLMLTNGISHFPC